MAAISVEEKGPAAYVVSAVVEHLRAWGRKNVIFGIDGEPAIRALGVAIQHARSEETVIECRPKYPSPSMGPVENMNKELCGLVRCFRINWREKANMEITTESPLLPWLVRHCGWILSRYAVGADGRTGYSRLEGREYTAGIAIFGVAIRYKLPKTADLTKLDDRWRTAIWLEKSDISDEHIIGLENGAVLARSVRRKVEGKRCNERALKMVTGMPWNPCPGKVVARRRYMTRASVERYGPTEDCGHASERVSITQNDVRHDLSSSQSRPEPRRGSRLHQDPVAPNLISTSTAAQTGGVDTDVMESEDIEPAVSSEAHATAAPIIPFVTGSDETMEQEGPESNIFL